MGMNPPRSAYLHVPFCRHRCGYCNFAVVADRIDLVSDYLDAIERELNWLQKPRPVKTLYFGGGTPTRLPLEQLKKLLRLAKQWFPVEEPDNFEWTVEANPADLPSEAIKMLAEEGVTRISLGAQSFNGTKLKKLERDHNDTDICRTVETAHKNGLDVSIDLIFAAPGETLDEWKNDLQKAVDLKTSHVSTYGLTFEKGTTFWNRLHSNQLNEVEEDLQRKMYLTSIEILTNAGFDHYEVSNFAKPGCRSRHNEAYWAGQEYYAVGPGAARYLDGVRETNHRSTTTYLKRVLNDESPVAEREELTAEQRARERLVFGLRRIEGVNRSQFHQSTGYEIENLVESEITKLVDLGMLEQTSTHLRLTREGLLVSDALWPELL